MHNRLISVCRFYKGDFVYGIHDHNDKSAHISSVCHTAHVSRDEVSDHLFPLCSRHHLSTRAFDRFFSPLQMFFLCIRQFKKAVTDAIMSRRAIRNMNTL